MIRPWKKLGSKPLGDFRIFTLRADRAISPRTGHEHEFFVIDCVNWVNVIAVTPDKELPVSRLLPQMPRTTMNLTESASWLVALGCPEEKSLEMARQLDKRARQLAEQTGKTYEEAMAHLLNLMKQGWAAKEKGHQQ